MHGQNTVEKIKMCSKQFTVCVCVCVTQFTQQWLKPTWMTSVFSMAATDGAVEHIWRENGAFFVLSLFLQINMIILDHFITSVCAVILSLHCSLHSFIKFLIKLLITQSV